MLFRSTRTTLTALFPAIPYGSITATAGPATSATRGRQRTRVLVGYPQAAYLVIAAESSRVITNQCEKVHVSALQPGLMNFARMRGPGRYGSSAGGADGPPLPKQPRRHSTATRLPMPQQPGYHGPADIQGS